MELRRVSINGILYGSLYKSADAKNRLQDEKYMRVTMSKLCDTTFISDNVSFVDVNLHPHIIEAGLQAAKIREFFTLLAICHTVFAEIPDPSCPNKILYKAQSPDEAALVTAAKDVGFVFLKRAENIVTINVLGEIRNYEVLKVMEFNSNRKRMSVIIKRPEGEIVLLCKGADSVILPRLIETTETFIKETAYAHLSDFANEGIDKLYIYI